MEASVLTILCDEVANLSKKVASLHQQVSEQSQATCDNFKGDEHNLGESIEQESIIASGCKIVTTIMFCPHASLILLSL
jgi:hypothetical protein